MRRNIIIFIITIVLTLFFSEFVSADTCGGTGQCHCGDMLIESQVMWYDLVDCPNDGLMVGANNIILDCNGHLIDGDNPVFDNLGIYVFYSHVTVTNCNVQEFYEGIFIEKASWNNIVSFNNVINNRITGIRINDLSEGNTLLGNVVRYNYVGISLATEADNNLVFSNTLINNEYGISVIGYYNTIWDNTFASNIENAEEWTGFNKWNLSDVGNYWDDFPSNPGYPDYYEIPGEGSGIDWHPSFVEFYVDDSDEEFIILSGEWNLRHHYNAYNNEALYNNPGFGLERAGWKVNNLVFSGTYEVYVWKFEHEYLSRMGTNVHYMVYHRTGTSNWIIVNQQTPGNEWIYLGEFEFDNSHGQGVMITDEANGRVVADVIKLVYEGPLSNRESSESDMFNYLTKD